MANTCNICGAQINLFQTQKLADGNCICRKNCRSQGFKLFDYVHATLPEVNAHIAQVKRGTSLWEHYFVPKLKEKDKAKKLKRFGGDIYIAADIGLMAITQNDYKFFVFGKTTRACVYRIADIRDYEYEVREVKSGEKIEKMEFVRMSFVNTEGMNMFSYPLNGGIYNNLVKYLNELFGIQKTLGNFKNTAKKQFNAVKDVASGFKAVLGGDEDAMAKAEQAADSLDAAVLGDRKELEAKADAALAAFPG